MYVSCLTHDQLLWYYFYSRAAVFLTLYKTLVLKNMFYGWIIDQYIHTYMHTFIPLPEILYCCSPNSLQLTG